MFTHRFRRAAIGAPLAAGVLLMLSSPSALAHVGTDKSEVVAGESTTVTFAIGHGCDGSPTSSMKFQIPDSVVTAAPQVKPGWTITTERADLAAPIDSGHGEPQTDRVSVITFTADEGNATDATYRDTFTIAFTAPEEEGELAFKVIQGCETGENAWIDEWDGTGEEPENPAPSVMVVAAPAGDDGGHDDAGATTVPTADVGDPVTSTAATVATAPADDDDASNGLAITGIVVGGLGLVAGGAALARGRRGS